MLTSLLSQQFQQPKNTHPMIYWHSVLKFFFSFAIYVYRIIKIVIAK